MIRTLRTAPIAALLAALLSSTAYAAAAAVVPDPGTAELAKLAERLGIDLSDAKTAGRVGNTLGIGGRTAALVQRLDSLTFVYTNDAYHAGDKIGVFAGTDGDLAAIAQKDLDALHVPIEQLVGSAIAPEFGQAASYSRATGRSAIEKPVLLNRFVVFARAIDGLPVFSSYARIGLTQKGGVGSLRVHWPAIDEATLKSGLALQARVREGYRPPNLAGATPESATAGIIHSPAFAETMDVVPAVRVVYRPTAAGIGKKTVLYLDLNGKPVPTPRTFLKAPYDPRQLPRTKQALRYNVSPNASHGVASPH